MEGMMNGRLTCYVESKGCDWKYVNLEQTEISWTQLYGLNMKQGNHKLIT